MTHAQLIILVLAPLQWVVVFIGLRLMPLRTKSRIIKLAIGLVFALLYASVPIAQIFLYRTMTGRPRSPGRDPFFLGVFYAGNIVSVGMLLAFAFWDIAKDRQHK
jgi:hypothetical protein